MHDVKSNCEGAIDGDGGTRSAHTPCPDVCGLYAQRVQLRAAYVTRRQNVRLAGFELETASCWIKVEAAVDSGAVDPVINQDVVPHLQVQPTPESERGESWTAAGGHEIRKMGEVTVPWVTNHGTMKRSRFKVGKVSRTLISVSRLNECGYEAILSKWWPRLIHRRSGETITLRCVRGMFIVDMWIQVPSGNGAHDLGFPRHP